MIGKHLKHKKTVYSDDSDSYYEEVSPRSFAIAQRRRIDDSDSDDDLDSEPKQLFSAKTDIRTLGMFVFFLYKIIAHVLCFYFKAQR